MASNDRFGFRPTPAVRPPSSGYDHSPGRDAKQKMLQKIQSDRLRRQWTHENATRGREGWVGFGNRDLPAWHYKQEVMDMVATNRVSILGGETGSGKSTQLAQWALEMGYDHVVYLQPRRVTTDNIADRIDEELTEQFEKKRINKPENLVGVAHSERSTIKQDSVIQVMTSAVFTRRAPELSRQWRDKKVLIVADEIHEANIETEFAVATAAEVLQDKPNWNMTLVSATVNSNEIRQAYTTLNDKQIPSITIEGRPHTIDYHERPNQTVADVYDEVIENANKALIFTDGKRSIAAIKAEIQRRHPEARILVLHSKISDAQRQEIFKDESDQKTVIISTSAGQSGITIPGVDTVISDGWTKSPELDGENASGLPRRYCSKSEITQQMGRGARDIEGGNFYLARSLPVTRRIRPNISDDIFVGFSERDEHAPADIYHTVITRNVLRAAAMHRDFYTTNEYLIHKVTKDTIDEAYAVLKLMGSVDERNEVTDIGDEMDRYPLRPELARALAEVQQRGSLKQRYQLAAITAAIETEGIASFNPEKRRKLDESRASGLPDDFIAQLDYFLQSAAYLSAAEDEENLNQLGYDAQNVSRAHRQYAKICRAMGLDTDARYTALSAVGTPEEAASLHGMLLTGMPHLMYQEVSRQRSRGRQKTGRDGKKIPQPPIIKYRNILGPGANKSYKYDRRISSRSALAGVAIKATEIVAGYPRWFIDDDGDTQNVIEIGFVTNRTAVHKALGKRATDIRSETKILPNGRLTLVDSSHIGRLRTGQERRNTVADSEDKVKLLVQEALDKPGPAQRELRRLKRTLADLARRVPQNRRSYYFDKPTITDDDITRLLVSAAKGAGSLGQLDANLRATLYKRGIMLSGYITPDHQQSIEENMPNSILVGGHWYDISYDSDPEATPYIVNFLPKHAEVLPEHLHLPDGREVLFRFRDRLGNEDSYPADELRNIRHLL